MDGVTLIRIIYLFYFYFYFSCGLVVICWEVEYWEGIAMFGYLYYKFTKEQYGTERNDRAEA